MSICVVTGSAGLIGAEAVRFFSSQGVPGRRHRQRHAAGILRRRRLDRMEPPRTRIATIPGLYAPRRRHPRSRRDRGAVRRLRQATSTVIIHTAAQPSHDWAAKDPHTDFSVNANGTLILLEATRKHCPEASFIFTSTNKVYGDNPNCLPLVEQRDALGGRPPPTPTTSTASTSRCRSISTKHSLFGVSKLAADVMVQEYGRYFGMNTGCFRGGCLTGPGHSGTMLHGFLSYLVKCAFTGQPLHGLRLQGQAGPRQHPLLRPGQHVLALSTRAPRPGEVYNAGGGRHSNCSMHEAIALCEQLDGQEDGRRSTDDNRDRRPHLVHQRHPQVPGRTIRAGHTVRHPAHHRRDLRIDGRRVAAPASPADRPSRIIPSV